MGIFFDGDALTGTASNDFFFPRGATGINDISAGNGNDVIYGEFGAFPGITQTRATAALALTSGNITASNLSQIWNQTENRDIIFSTSVSHTTMALGGFYGSQIWFAITVVAGAEITLDVDYGRDTNNTDTDTQLRIFQSDGVTSLAFNDDAAVLDTGSTSTLDSYLNYTFATAGTYLINVTEFGATDGNLFEFDDQFMLHISLTGQAANLTNIAQGADTIRGGAGDDIVYGMGGDDFIYGGLAAVDATETGNDTLYGDDGKDSIYGNGGDDLIYGGLGADFLIGGTGNDTIYGGSSSGDTIDFSDDFMRGGDGVDTLYGNGGNDTMAGGAGTDAIYGGFGNDIIYGGALLVDATDTGDTISGGYGKDDIRGNGGVDFLHGNEDDDIVIGGLGDDFIWGESGNDYLRGGDGADKFIFDTELDDVSNVDTIQNFVSGVDDIWLNQTIFAGIGDTLDASEFQNSSLPSSGEGTYRIFYNQATGQLFYDSNGSDAGGSTLFAVMTVASGALPVLTVADFAMVA
jgi:Ca2+-binding RTX toxin-like protein